MAKVEVTEAKEQYVLLHGKHLGNDPETGERKTFTPGDVVFLTAVQAHSFRDRFKPISLVQAEAERSAEVAKKAAELAEANAKKAAAANANKVPVGTPGKA